MKNDRPERTHNHMADALYHVPTIYKKILKKDSPLTVRVPGSKSITNRSLLLAMLADGKSTLRGVLFSDDSRHFLQCVQDLGFDTTVEEAACVVTVKGLGGKIPCKEASLNVGSAGTAARFLTATLGVSEGSYHMNASEQMRKRPMAPLLSSLEELGCEIACEGEPGHFPFTLTSHSFGQNHISIDIGHSSQFLSALLIASTLSDEDFTIQVVGTHGMAYIEMTQKMMEQFGVCVERPASDQFRIPTGQKYKALDYQIEPDVSAACYFYAMAPLLGIPVIVEHVHFDCLQGDVEFLHILEKMGCTAQETANGVLLLPPGYPAAVTIPVVSQDTAANVSTNRTTAAPIAGFHGVTADMSSCSDQAITLAAIAPFADSPTCIQGIGHIRFQESDRIHAICTELTRMGIRCEETQDSITIYPGMPRPCTIETYNDHRMAMGFALTGLRAEGIMIKDPGCCRKTFENYFEVLDQVIYKLMPL